MCIIKWKQCHSETAGLDTTLPRGNLSALINLHMDSRLHSPITTINLHSIQYIVKCVISQP